MHYDAGMMRLLLAAGLLGVALSGCSNDQAQLSVLELTGPTMGTSYSVKLVAPPADIDREALNAQIDGSLARIEQRMSTYQADSELSLFNRSESTDWIEVSAELCGVIEQALSVSEITSAFDITVGPLVNLWGFGPADARLNLLITTSSKRRCKTRGLRNYIHNAGHLQSAKTGRTFTSICLPMPRDTQSTSSRSCSLTMDWTITWLR